MNIKRTILSLTPRNPDESFMLEALKEALKAEERGEVPVGAVIVKDGAVIGRGHNLSITLSDPTAHAEIIALRQASQELKNYRLTGCRIYVTVEPCAMCAGALVWARVSDIVFGAQDAKAGACGSVFSIADSDRLNHRITVTGGLLEKECRAVMQDFFRKKRNAALSGVQNKARRQDADVDEIDYI